MSWLKAADDNERFEILSQESDFTENQIKLLRGVDNVRRLLKKEFADSHYRVGRTILFRNKAIREMYGFRDVNGEALRTFPPVQEGNKGRTQNELMMELIPKSTIECKLSRN